VQDGASGKQLVDHRMIFATYFFLEQRAPGGHFPTLPAILFFHRDRDAFEGAGVAPLISSFRFPCRFQCRLEMVVGERVYARTHILKTLQLRLENVER
jgi:hypothetical protein